jgi:PAS domain S-box-containing protein
MTKLNQQLTLTSIKEKLTDTVVWSSNVFLIVAVASSLSRIPVLGFLPVMYFHILASAAFIAVFLCRKSLSTKFKGAFVCFSFFVIGVSGVHNFGISAAGVFFIYSSCIISSLIINVRTGLIIAVLGLFTLFLHFYLYRFTSFEFNVAQGDYNGTNGAWALIISVYIYVTSISLFLIHRFFNYLKILLERQQVDLDKQSNQLEYSTILLRTIINRLPFDILWKDKSLTYVSANEGFAKYIGKSQGISHYSQLAGKTDQDFFCEETININKKMEQALLSGESELFTYEHTETNSDGRLLYKQIQRIGLTDKDESIMGVLVVSNDITHLKELEFNALEAKAEAQRANAAKSEFLANMSHEIRTPLNGIFGLLDLGRQSNDVDRIHHFLKKAEQSASLLTKILNDVLDLSKIEAKQLQLETIDFNLHDVMLKAGEIFEEQAVLKDLAFESDFIGDKQLNLIGDPTRILQILVNLISNALKFTHKGCIKVKISQLVSEDHAKVELSVIDSGIGISQSNIPYLFDSFKQAQSSIARQYGGTGLGLAIVKSLCEQLNGELKVSSIVDKGSQFSLRFKLPVSQQHAAQEYQVPLLTTFTGVHILLVEDNEINQEIAQAMLSQAGFQVTLAGNGKEAIELMNHTRFDFVYMDIQMPVMDGLTAIKIIRRNKQWCNIPVVALTANVMAGEIANYISCGFNGHIGKPYSREKLIAGVSSHLLENA